MVGGIFIATCAVIVLTAKAGFIVALSMAPLGIMMLLWEGTRQYFQGWVSLVIGFAIIPLLLGCLMAIVLYFAGHLLATSGASSSDKDKYFGFVFFMIAVLVLLFHIPTMAHALASAFVTVGGASVAGSLTSATGRISGASALQNAVMSFPTRALGSMINPRKYLPPGSAAVAAVAPTRAGGSAADIQKSGFAPFRQHSNDRKEDWRRRLHES
ncbi:type IV secretion system protein [Rhizobium leguminosarum]|nr:type IV secretion system protein [Rhizobium leguminosarum]